MPDPEQVRSMFTRIAGTYDGLNRTLSMGIDQRWRKAVLREAGELRGARVLDLCCGTGDLSRLFAQAGATVIGADFTFAMVQRAPAKLTPGGDWLFVQGDAMALPVPDASMDVVSVAFGIRNVADAERCLAEMLRVLKPGGRALVLEFPPPGRNPMGQAFRVYFRHILPRIGGLVSGDPDAYRYLPRTVLAWPAPPAFAETMAAVGFEGVRYQVMTGGIACLHVGTRPQEGV
ncbi:MAG: bifunctional demethylmenaquinone methyltransferase/2-methoxy-6-polyprenyl-1,4-benzoquinol methylase UbiE [Planctomycetota bacterium]